MLDAPNHADNHHIPANVGWSAIIRKGQMMRIIDLEGQQAVDTLFYSAADTSERYSAQDTVFAQRSPYITEGSVLLSNEGRPMMTVLRDPVGAHDTSAGACSCEANTVRFGHEVRHLHACRDNFVTEAAKWGMDKRDIVANVNFFMNVPIETNGALAISDGLSAPSNSLDLRAEMDVICLISNCPQINNPCNGFNPTPINVLIWTPEEV
ncbi:urea amidolyase associated protein UAAP2 [Antarctobacter jejuensis]|uniref:urea amidolyase associated protein UAAP2 n=1 Tax=Antarctobacter jejuensis TaxID=1439938 RepID=UPI003FD602CB